MERLRWVQVLRDEPSMRADCGGATSTSQQVRSSRGCSGGAASGFWELSGRARVKRLEGRITVFTSNEQGMLQRRPDDEQADYARQYERISTVAAAGCRSFARVARSR